MQDEHEERSVMDTAFLKQVGRYVLTAILSLLVIFYLLYHLFNGFNVEIETEPAFLTTQHETLTLDAYVIRNETVLYAKTGGGVNYAFEDGEKVSKNAKIADVYSDEGGRTLTAEIIEIDNKIAVLENSNEEKNNPSSDTQIIDSRINELYYSIREKIEQGDLEYALRKKNELLTLLNKRQIVVQAVESFDDKIVSYRNERNAVASQMSDISETLYADRSGYFYTTVDGYESIFTVEAAESLTLESFDRMVSSEPSSGSGNAVGKIVTDYNWYIVCEITKEQNRFFSEGSSYRVIFPYSASEEISMKLQRIVSPTDSDRILLLFQTGTLPEGFNYLRKQEIEVVQSEYTGYKVPLSSVRMVDGVQGVYILVGNVVKFKTVEPLLEQNDYYIVKEQPTWMEDENYQIKLGLYDLIITKGTGLYDGKIVDA